MAFEFLCPQGHRLQCDETLVGQASKCPYCQSEFLIPPPVGQAPAGQMESAGAPVSGASAAGPSISPAEDLTPRSPREPDAEAFPGIRIGPELTPQEAPGPTPSISLSRSQEEQLLHIPCPRGHELETPREMLGQPAMCPFCQTQFYLRLEDSREYRQDREEAQERREQRLGKAWLHWAIAAAVVVALGVIALVAISMAT